MRQKGESNDSPFCDLNLGRMTTSAIAFLAQSLRTFINTLQSTFCLRLPRSKDRAVYLK